MNIKKFIHEHMIETCLLAGALTIVPMQYYLRHSGQEPAYLSKLSVHDKAYCISEAKEGKHNVGFLGGSDGEYLVALEDCAHRVDPVAFK